MLLSTVTHYLCRRCIAELMLIYQRGEVDHLNQIEYIFEAINSLLGTGEDLCKETALIVVAHIARSAVT